MQYDRLSFLFEEEESLRKKKKKIAQQDPFILFAALRASKDLMTYIEDRRALLTQLH